MKGPSLPNSGMEEARPSVVGMYVRSSSRLSILVSTTLMSNCRANAPPRVGALRLVVQTELGIKCSPSTGMPARATARIVAW